MAEVIDEVIKDKNQIKSQSGNLDFVDGEIVFQRNFGKIRIFNGPTVVQTRQFKTTDKLYDVASFTTAGDAASLNDNFDIAGYRFLGSSTTLSSSLNGSQVVSIVAGSVRHHIFVVAKEEVTLTDQAYDVTQLRCGIAGSETILSTSSYHTATGSPSGAYPQMIYDFHKFAYYDLTASEIASGIKVQNFIQVMEDSIILKKLWVFGV